MPTSLLTPTVLKPLLVGKDYTILHMGKRLTGKCLKQMHQGYKKKSYNISRQEKKLFLLFLKLFSTPSSSWPTAVLSNECLPDLGGSFLRPFPCASHWPIWLFPAQRQVEKAHRGIQSSADRPSLQQQPQGKEQQLEPTTTAYQSWKTQRKCSGLTIADEALGYFCLGMEQCKI